MLFDRISLVEAYDALRVAEANEGIISQILFNKTAYYGTKTVVRFDSVRQLRQHIEQNFAYQQFDPNCECATCNDSIWQLLSFTVQLPDMRYVSFVNNLRGQFESAEGALLNKTTKDRLALVFRKNSRLAVVKKNATCFGYIENQGKYVSPCDYITVIKNDYHDELIALYQKTKGIYGLARTEIYVDKCRDVSREKPAVWDTTTVDPCLDLAATHEIVDAQSIWEATTTLATTTEATTTLATTEATTTLATTLATTTEATTTEATTTEATTTEATTTEATTTEATTTEATTTEATTTEATTTEATTTEATTTEATTTEATTTEATTTEATTTEATTTEATTTEATTTEATTTEATTTEATTTEATTTEATTTEATTTEATTTEATTTEATTTEATTTEATTTEATTTEATTTEATTTEATTTEATTTEATTTEATTTEATTTEATTTEATTTEATTTEATTTEATTTEATTTEATTTEATTTEATTTEATTTEATTTEATTTSTTTVAPTTTTTTTLAPSNTGYFTGEPTYMRYFEYTGATNGTNGQVYEFGGFNSSGVYQGNGCLEIGEWYNVHVTDGVTTFEGVWALGDLQAHESNPESWDYGSHDSFQAPGRATSVRGNQAYTCYSGGSNILQTNDNQRFKLSVVDAHGVDHSAAMLILANQFGPETGFAENPDYSGNTVTVTWGIAPTPTTTEATTTEATTTEATTTEATTTEATTTEATTTEATTTAAPWTPLSLGPVAWIDAADTSSYTRSGTSLQSVTDKAGTYSTITVGGNPVTNSSTQNGLNVFDFDGSDFLQSGGTNSQTYRPQVSSGNHFALGVFRYEGTNSTQDSVWSYETNQSPKRDYAISSGNGSNSWPGELDMDGLSSSSNRISTTIGNLQVWNLKSLVRNQYHIVACWFNKTGNQIGVRVDGQNAFTPVNDYDNSIQTNQQLRLMRNRASQELDGKMGEFVAFASMPGTSGTDMSHLEKAEGYLAHKWGLTGSLPSNHPYKNTPPTA